MIIEVDIDYLIKNKITADEFVLLQMILEDKKDRIESFKNVVRDERFNEIIEALKFKGFLETAIENESGYAVTSESLSVFKGKGRFEEFYAKFPVSVIRPDGNREQLRTAKARCKTKYNRLAKRKDVHEHIMSCLEKEISHRKSKDSMKFMKKMPNWLAAESWKEFEGMDESLVESIETTYGTELI